MPASKLDARKGCVDLASKRLNNVIICVVMAVFVISSSTMAGNARHKIHSGDTLWDLAKKYHTTPKAIARANGIKETSTLALGKSLQIPGTSKTRAKASKLARKTYQAPPAKSYEVASAGKSNLVRTALSCRGTRYSRGGTSRGGFDCSGFTRYVYAKYGISLPHSTAAQAHLGRPVSKSELAAGDLVFFHTHRAGISHVGIYIGNGRFVHSATHGRGVVVDSLNAAYYAPRYRGARRVR